VGVACGYFFLGGPLPPPLDGQFELADSRRVGPFRIDRYRSDDPVTISKKSMVEPFDADGSFVMVDS
jgi:hypothetical protein